MSIVVCYDGSPSSKSAVVKAASVIGHEHAVLLHVWNPPERVLADAFSTRDIPGPPYAELESQVRERAQEIAEQGRALAVEHGLDAEARDEPNATNIWRTILDVAGREDAKLIVVGTHSGTAVQDGSLGSVSNALAHHSDRAVLIVPAGDPAS
jgi:nucleotide-binding universal stress UspA family protein